jgi:hypothetical protein
MEPGPVLAAFLGHIDVDRCSGHDRIRVLRAQQRLVSWTRAQMYRTMSSIVDVIDAEDMPTEHVEQAAAIEVAAALRLTRRASEAEMELALDLERRLPAVWRALLAGDIDVRRARVIVDETIHLSIAGAQQVVDGVIADAGRLTTGQLGHRLRKMCFESDPDDAKRRYRTSVEERCIVTEATPDGTGNFYGMNLPPERLQAGMARINRIARSLRRKGETRTMDQLRSDVFLDLVAGTGTVSRSGAGGVHLHSDLASLAELADHPGELAGYGPVIADIARQVARQQQAAPWEWTIDDPATGMPIAHGSTRRRPTTRQRRHVTTRDTTCIFPGCRMPAMQCDVDHRIRYAESHTTRTGDLAPLCRYHHTNRHRHRWTYRHSSDGDYTFTSPLGHEYTTSGRDP